MGIYLTQFHYVDLFDGDLFDSVLQCLSISVKCSSFRDQDFDREGRDKSGVAKGRERGHRGGRKGKGHSG